MNHQVESSQVSYRGVFYCNFCQGGTNFERAFSVQSQEHSDPRISGISGLPYINIIQMLAGDAQDLQHCIVTDLPEN